MTKATRKWSARAPLFWGFLTLLLLVGGLGAWSVLTTISGAIIAPGQIEVAQNRQVIQHPDGGVVEAINVSEGSTVQAGDVLLRLDGALLRSELAIVENQLFELFARRARLEAERDNAETVDFPLELKTSAGDRAEVSELMQGQMKLFVARRDTMEQQLDQRVKRSAQIVSQIEGIDAKSAAMGRQLSLIEQELEIQQGLLAKGLAQAPRVLELQREEARMEGEVGDLKSTRAQAEGRITEIEIEKLGLQSQRREDAGTDLRDVAYRELELAERRRSLTERVERLEIRAPVSGVVFGLLVTTPRSVIRAAEPVMYLIPQDRPLVIAAKVPTIHVDEIHIGQEVRLHFSAFSSRLTAEIYGRVTVISADAMKDDRTQVSYYRAEISLEPGEAAKMKDEVLVPGMPVEAFIRTNDRTPLAYIIKPFTDYFERAFRET